VSEPSGGRSIVNKDDISTAVYEAHGGLSIAEARRIVDITLDLIKGRLLKGEKVLLSGFGSFRVIHRKDRKGINPQTGESIIIAGRKAVSFKPSKYLKTV
jgi:nucleoid DNA-binding protein